MTGTSAPAGPALAPPSDPLAPQPAPPLRIVNFPAPPQIPSDVVQARNEIAMQNADRDWYQQYRAEREAGVYGPAVKARAELEARAYPTVRAIHTPVDAAAQAEQRANKAMDMRVADLGRDFDVSPRLEQQTRDRKINPEQHRRTVEKIERLKNDKLWFQRWKAGGAEEKATWRMLTEMRGFQIVPGHPDL